MTWAELKAMIEGNGVQDEMIIDVIDINSPDALNVWIPSGDECVDQFGLVIKNAD